MTENGETDNFSAADHLKVIMKHIGQQIFDYVVVNNGFIDQEEIGPLPGGKAVPVEASVAELQELD